MTSDYYQGDEACSVHWPHCPAVLSSKFETSVSAQDRHSTDVLSSTIAKKKADTEPKVPLRKWTAPIGMRFLRHRRRIWTFQYGPPSNHPDMTMSLHGAFTSPPPESDREAPSPAPVFTHVPVLAASPVKVSPPTAGRRSSGSPHPLPRRESGETTQKWLNPTINVLYAFSVILGEGVGLAFSPADVIFAGVGALFLVVSFVYSFIRFEIYAKVPSTPAMTDAMVKIVVEVLDILATATKEMKQKFFLKKVAGVTNLEDGIKRLDKLTDEEARMANAVVLKVTHIIDEKVMEVGDGVKAVEKNVQVDGAQLHEVDENILGVGAKVKDVNGEVQVVNNSVKVIEEKVQLIVRKWCQPLTSTLTVSSLDGKAIAEEVRLDMQRTADDIDDDMKRS
ncbi:hypothetical protein EDB92DRAFT_1812732 [Lactarius akahatsu]|uniref:Uncharacterized protein n=1 Tax=Lactarius akahatsu TaxID=416441 RepID=A0AAD4LQM3_9AGAM|nr:hypothetical protein EDB92DRAFT_1812732 [Lactarius akahatsu]